MEQSWFLSNIKSFFWGKLYIFSFVKGIAKASQIFLDFNGQNLILKIFKSLFEKKIFWDIKDVKHNERE